MTTDTDQVLADVTYVERLIEQHTELQATRHVVFTDGHLVKVEVQGAYYEVRAWRAAMGGRGLPAFIDRHGVRRQVIICPRGIEVQVIEHPAEREDQP